MITIARNSKISLSGQLIRAQALQFAKHFSYNGFTESEGWLTRFKGTNNIIFGSVFGKSASVDQLTIDDWVVKKLPEIMKGLLKP